MHLLVFTETLHDFAVDHFQGKVLVSRGVLQAQISIVIGQVANERSRQEQEVKDQDRLPTKSEIRKLNRGTKKKLAELAERPKLSTTYQQYLEYCKYTIARIVVYNLRRSGEVASMSVKQFRCRTKGKIALTAVI